MASISSVGTNRSFSKSASKVCFFLDDQSLTSLSLVSKNLSKVVQSFIGKNPGFFYFKICDFSARSEPESLSQQKFRTITVTDSNNQGVGSRKQAAKEKYFFLFKRVFKFSTNDDDVASCQRKISEKVALEQLTRKYLLDEKNTSPFDFFNLLDSLALDVDPNAVRIMHTRRKNGEDFASLAAMQGKVPVLQWFLDNNPDILLTQIPIAQTATVHGKLNVLEWIYENQQKHRVLTLNSRIAITAAQANKVDVLDWLEKKQNLCSFLGYVSKSLGYNIALMAAFSGSIDVLNWIYERHNLFPLFERVCNQKLNLPLLAVLGKQPKVLEWIKQKPKLKHFLEKEVACIQLKGTLITLESWLMSGKLPKKFNYQVRFMSFESGSTRKARVMVISPETEALRLAKIYGSTSSLANVQ